MSINEHEICILDGDDQCHYCVKNQSLLGRKCEAYSLIPKDIWNSETKCPHFKAEEKAK